MVLAARISVTITHTHTHTHTHTPTNQPNNLKSGKSIELHLKAVVTNHSDIEHVVIILSEIEVVLQTTIGIITCRDETVGNQIIRQDMCSFIEN